MKYYNIESWSNDSSDVEQAINTYKQYIQSIQSQLPADLRSLALHEVSLNDSNVMSLELVVGSGELRIVMAGDVPTHPQRPFGWHILLRYRSLLQFTSKVDKDGFPYPHGYGDHGFDEIEIVDPGVYEHRMLFSSGIEFAVRFRDFSLILRPAEPDEWVT